MPAVRSLWRDVRRNRNAYLFIAPFFFIFAVFMVFPIALSLHRSFQRWNGIMDPRPVGFANYAHAFRDPMLLIALRNTFLFTVLTVLLATTGSLALALFLNSVRFLKRFYRAVFFIPAVVSLVIVSLVWKLILNSEVGLLHELLRWVGAESAAIMGGSVPQWSLSAIHLLDNPHWYVQLLTMTLVNIWAVIGFNTVIFLSGLQAVPSELYEATRMDGATPMQNFWHLTLPLLRPTTFFVVLMSTIDALQVFVLPNVMNRDSSDTMTIVYYLYRSAFEFQKMGYASAIAYLLFGITVGLTLVLRYTLGRNTRWS